MENGYEGQEKNLLKKEHFNLFYEKEDSPCL
jgi:hypothetical protein